MLPPPRRPLMQCGRDPLSWETTTNKGHVANISRGSLGGWPLSRFNEHATIPRCAVAKICAYKRITLETEICLGKIPRRIWMHCCDLSGTSLTTPTSVPFVGKDVMEAQRSQPLDARLSA